MTSFKGRWFEKEMILICVRWYLAYPLSYRNLEEMMDEHGLYVDHSTIRRWVFNYSPQLEQECHKRKKPVGQSWKLNETYIKVKGQWKYLYRAIDNEGQTVDFILIAKRDKKAAIQFMQKAIGANGEPEKVNFDKNGANTAALKAYNEETGPKVEIRQNKYLNNLVEQDHRGVKRITNSMKGSKRFLSAQRTLAGIELVRMIKKSQVVSGNDMSPEQ